MRATTEHQNGKRKHLTSIHTTSCTVLVRLALAPIKYINNSLAVVALRWTCCTVTASFRAGVSERVSVRRARLPFRLSRHSTTSYLRYLRPFFDRHFLLALSSHNPRLTCITHKAGHKASIHFLIVGPQYIAYFAFRR